MRRNNLNGCMYMLKDNNKKDYFLDIYTQQILLGSRL